MFAQDYGGLADTVEIQTAADYLEKWNSADANTCVLANSLNMYLFPLVYFQKKAATWYSQLKTSTVTVTGLAQVWDQLVTYLTHHLNHLRAVNHGQLAGAATDSVHVMNIMHV